MHKIEIDRCGKRFPVIFYHKRDLRNRIGGTSAADSATSENPGKLFGQIGMCQYTDMGNENERTNRVEAKQRWKEKKDEFRKTVGEVN